MFGKESEGYAIPVHGFFGFIDTPRYGLASPICKQNGAF